MNNHKRAGRPRLPTLDELKQQSAPPSVEKEVRLPNGLAKLKELWLQSNGKEVLTP